MNYLAHLLLAEDSGASMIGNLLPDMHRGRLPSDLDPVVLQGVYQHRRVDAFTDTHPVFARSCGRLRPRHGRYAGVLVDVLYDHVLSMRWSSYHPGPRGQFIEQAYRQMLAAGELMPPQMRTIMGVMANQDWLNNYATIEGIAVTLERMSAHLRERFERQVDLAAAAVDLREQYSEFETDFAAFFPDLLAHVGVDHFE